MRIGFEKNALGSLRCFVGTERDPWFRHLLTHVLLRHFKVNCADARFVLHKQVHDRFHRVLAARFRHLRERLAGQRL